MVILNINIDINIDKAILENTDIDKAILENMYFHAVKSTAHPPIIGALGHSTVFIAKQPNTATIKIDYSFKFFSSCEDF